MPVPTKILAIVAMMLSLTACVAAGGGQVQGSQAVEDTPVSGSNDADGSGTDDI